MEEQPLPLISWAGSTMDAKTDAEVLAWFASKAPYVVIQDGDPNIDSLPMINNNSSPDTFRCRVEPYKPSYRCTWEAIEEGIILLRQNWLPGWYATLDGKEHPVARVNMYMIGVHAPKGSHEISLQYRPQGFWTGLGLSLLGLLGVGAVIWKSGAKNTDA